LIGFVSKEINKTLVLWKNEMRPSVCSWVHVELSSHHLSLGCGTTQVLPQENLAGSRSWQRQIGVPTKNRGTGTKKERVTMSSYPKNNLIHGKHCFCQGNVIYFNIKFIFKYVLASLCSSSRCGGPSVKWLVTGVSCALDALLNCDVADCGYFYPL
jgi:hypothetical protein